MSTEFSQETNDLVQEVTRKVSKSNAIRLEDFENVSIMRRGRRGFTIIFIENFNSFLIFYQKVSPENFKFEGFYLIVSMSQSINVRNIFQAMWKLMIFNVDVVISDWQLESIDLITFLPFDGRTCNNLNPMKLNEFDISKLRWKNDEFFPSKFKNLQLCPIRLGTYESAPGLIIRTKKNVTDLIGFEGELFNQIAMSLNFSLKVNVVTYGSGTISENGTATGLVGKVMKNEFDLIFSLFSVSYYRNIFLSPTKSYYVDKMIIIIPADRLLDSFLKIFYVFDLTLWLTLFSIFAFVSFAIKLLQSNSSVLNEIRTPMLSLVVAIVGGSERKLPRKDFTRILLATALLFCMVVRSIYQGALFNLLKKDVLTNQIKTVNDVNKLRYSFYFVPSTEVRIKDSQIFQRKVVVTNGEAVEYRKKTLNANFHGVFVDYLAKTLYYNEHHFPKLKICEEHVMSSFVVAYMTRNHFLIDEVNREIEQLQSNGMLSFFIKKYTNYKHAKFKSQTIPTKLKMNNLIGAFQILLCGLLLGFCCFLTEVSVLFIRRKCSNLKGIYPKT